MPSDTFSVVVLDNGAHTIKAGLSNSVDSNPRFVRSFNESKLSRTINTYKNRIIYNAAIRSKGDKHLYIGHEFEKCQDYASLSYRLPFERVCDYS